jgi:hypothetical protein
VFTALKLAGASCRLFARVSFALTRFTLLKIEETFKTDSGESRSGYHDAIHDDDDDSTV